MVTGKALSTIDSRYRWGAALALGIALCVLWILWVRREPTVPKLFPSMSFLPNDQELAEDGYWPLPFGDVDPGDQLSGRPDVPMPISRKIYERVELFIDGKPVAAEPIKFRSSQTFTADGIIYGDENLPSNVGMDGHLGWVTRARNKRGWIIEPFAASLECSSSQRRATFRGEFVAPENPGEYLLVVISSAHIPPGPHPCLMAGAFDAVVE